MRILIDECVPRVLKRFLSNHGHECWTLLDAGWCGKKNSALLNLAEGSFDVLVTTDPYLQYQQRTTGTKITLLTLTAQTYRLIDISIYFDDCAQAIAKLRPAKVAKLEPPKQEAPKAENAREEIPKPEAPQQEAARTEVPPAVPPPMKEPVSPASPSAVAPKTDVPIRRRFRGDVA